MSASRPIRRALTLAATAALITTTACATVVTASPQRGQTAVNTAAKTPGWRVVTTVGPDIRPISGQLTAVSAKAAWSVWSGSICTVEHWTRGAWHTVTMPPKVAGHLFAPAAIGAGADGEVWLINGFNPPEAVRHTGGKWVLQPIPRWVLRPGDNVISAATAVFGPRDVWVFGLGVSAYAAHYNGHTWAKVKMPEVQDGVSAAAPGDIWALGPNVGFVMHWNGTKWVKVAVPVLPLPYGATVSYSNVTAVGPGDAWLTRTISYKSGPPATTMMHWNGKTWLTVASPADVVASLVPDGHGGLWADATNINPGGFWHIYHLAGRHWTKFTPPSAYIHSAQELTLIPGTRSVWATGSNYNPNADYNHKGYFGVILRYTP